MVGAIDGNTNNTEANDNAPSIILVENGDKQLDFQFEGSGAIVNSQLDKNVVFRLNYNSTVSDPSTCLTPATQTNPVRSALSAIKGTYTWKNSTQPTLTTPFANSKVQIYEDGLIRGKRTVTDLDNARATSISIGMMNKYGFVSKLSEVACTVPQEVQVFIDEKSCFLLSASFQKDHPVLEYFRHIRDQYLWYNKYTRMFVYWYYQTAPHYTDYILSTPWLQTLIRGLATFFYYLFNQLAPILIVMSSLFNFFVWKKWVKRH